MKHQMQPNRWSCSVTSAAMIMNVDVEDLIHDIGHDGSEIMFPELSPPLCFRGFDISEIIDVAISLGWLMTPIYAIPTATTDGKNVYDVIPEFQIKPRMDFYFKHSIGIAYGLRGKCNHVVAWDGKDWHDPSGPITKKPTIDISVFWIFHKLNS